jgi:hypothetical protein
VLYLGMKMQYEIDPSKELELKIREVFDAFHKLN